MVPFAERRGVTPRENDLVELSLSILFQTAKNSCLEREGCNCVTSQANSRDLDDDTGRGSVSSCKA